MKRLAAAGGAALAIAGGAASLSEDVSTFTANVMELGEVLGLGGEVQVEP